MDKAKGREAKQADRKMQQRASSEHDTQQSPNRMPDKPTRQGTGRHPIIPQASASTPSECTTKESLAKEPINRTTMPMDTATKPTTQDDRPSRTPPTNPPMICKRLSPTVDTDHVMLQEDHRPRPARTSRSPIVTAAGFRGGPLRPPSCSARRRWTRPLCESDAAAVVVPARHLAALELCPGGLRIRPPSVPDKASAAAQHLNELHVPHLVHVIFEVLPSRRRRKASHANHPRRLRRGTVAVAASWRWARPLGDRDAAAGDAPARHRTALHSVIMAACASDLCRYLTYPVPPPRTSANSTLPACLMWSLSSCHAAAAGMPVTHTARNAPALAAPPGGPLDRGPVSSSIGAMWFPRLACR